MKIEIDNPATAALHDSECMADEYRVEFNDDGEATVREDVGEALAEKYPGIEVVGDPPPPDSADDAAGEQADDNSDSGNGSDNQ